MRQALHIAAVFYLHNLVCIFFYPLFYVLAPPGAFLVFAKQHVAVRQYQKLGQRGAHIFSTGPAEGHADGDVVWVGIVGFKGLADARNGFFKLLLRTAGQQGDEFVPPPCGLCSRGRKGWCAG